MQVLSWPLFTEATGWTAIKTSSRHSLMNTLSQFNVEWLDWHYKLVIVMLGNTNSVQGVV